MHREIRKYALALVLTAVVMLGPLLTSEGAVYADISGDNGKTIPSATVSIPVKHEITGGKYTGDDRFEFILTASGDNTPMPAGSNGRTRSVTVSGSESPDFGSITFEYPGAYYYTVSRAQKNYDRLDADDSVFTVMVAKFNDGITETVIWNEDGEKVDGITYTDVYEAPLQRSTPKTGDQEFRKAALRWMITGAGALALMAVILVASAAGRLSRAERSRKGVAE